MPAPTTDQPFRVLIVGAGLAGLSAAIALRGPGRDVVVLEQSRLKSEIGAAIHLAPNATKCVQKWGLDIEKAANAVVCRRITEIGGDGKVHHSIPLDTAKIFGAPWLFNHRVDLHSALRDFAVREDGPGAPVRIVTSARVTGVDSEAGKVTTDTGDVYEADLVVGADGIHSEVRKEVLGAVKVAQPSGHSAYRCLIPVEKLQDIPEALDMMNPAESGMKIVVQGDRRVVLYPCRRGTILNIVAICPDGLMQEDAEQSWNIEGTIENMVSAFESFPPWLLNILSRAEKPGLWQLRDQDPLSTWVKGRVIIIGDAAHSMLPHQGQGAGQSVEDAEALGAYFEGISTPQTAEAVNKILEHIFSVRIGRSSIIQKYSREQAHPVGGDGGTHLNAQQFAGYNMSYPGARAWEAKQAAGGQAQQPVGLPQ